MAIWIPMMMLIAGLWLVPALYTLVTIGRREFDGTTAILWVVIVLIAPILGVVAFWLVNPQSKLTMAGGGVADDVARKRVLLIMLSLGFFALVFPFLLVILLRSSGF